MIHWPPVFRKCLQLEFSGERGIVIQLPLDIRKQRDVPGFRLPITAHRRGWPITPHGGVFFVILRPTYRWVLPLEKGIPVPLSLRLSSRNLGIFMASQRTTLPRRPVPRLWSTFTAPRSWSRFSSTRGWGVGVDSASALDAAPVAPWYNLGVECFW